jgi:hypothetical protein
MAPAGTVHQLGHSKDLGAYSAEDPESRATGTAPCVAHGLAEERYCGSVHSLRSIALDPTAVLAAG